MDALATLEQLAARCQAFDRATMEDRASALLADASARVTALLARSGRSVDPGDEVQAANLAAVVCAAVSRAIGASSVAGGAPVSQWTQTATPYSTSYIFSNPNGDMYLTRQELALIGASGGRAGCCAPVVPGA